jgi:hypothetical protein
LQYEFRPNFLMPPLHGRDGPSTGPPRRAGAGRGGDSELSPIALPPQPPDAIDKFLKRLKGQTFALRSPHDLADAIHRIRSEVRPSNRPDSPFPAAR